MPVRVGRSRFVPAGAGTLPPGQRAAPGTVGYLGNEASLILLNSNDSLGALASDAEWVSGELRINTDNFTLQGYKIRTSVHSVGATKFTVRNCVIDDVGNHIYGITTTSSTGITEVWDTTVRGVPEGDGSVGIYASSNNIRAYRCDVSGFEDSFACGSPSIIDQCYGHDLDTAGTDPHNDVVQHYPGSGSGFSVTNSYLIQPLASACLTFDTDNACVATNNYFKGGGYFVRFEGATNVVFSNNEFGQLTTGEFGLVLKTGGATIATWSNNIDYQGNPVSQP